jgi:hypothetical protein
VTRGHEPAGGVSRSIMVDNSCRLLCLEAWYARGKRTRRSISARTQGQRGQCSRSVRSHSHGCSDAVNADHAEIVKLSVAPSRLVVSRTMTPSALATSTHSPPLSEL